MPTDLLESARLRYESAKLEEKNRVSPLRNDLKGLKQMHLEMNIKKQFLK